MALFDDPRFLLSHIRHSFRTSDESRMYELAMVTDMMHQAPYEAIRVGSRDSTTVSPSSILSAQLDLYSVNDPELIQIAHSCDIVMDNELVGAHRRRSNTAHRLEKLKKERRIQAKIKRITLRNPHPSETNEIKDGSTVLVAKDIHREDPNDQKKVVSLLSHLLITKPLPVNPFSAYARLDVRNQPSTKTIRVFLPMLPEDQREFPMTVTCDGNTTVGDVIGLICWLYTSEGRKPELIPHTKYYCLRIAEETGELEDEFPSVDNREPIGKYDFPSYQLQETNPEEMLPPVVTFYMKEGFSKVTLENHDAKLKDAVEELFKRRTGLQDSIGSDYAVEKKSHPGVALNLDDRLDSFYTTEFRLIAEPPMPVQTRLNNRLQSKLPELKMYSADTFQTYMVQMIQKIGKNVTVQLAISSEKIEITPLPLKAVNKMLWQVKPASHNMRDIAGCELMAPKTGGDKRCFKIVYMESEVFKDYMFEAPNDKAVDIDEQLKYILQMRSTDAQKAYQLERQRKLSRKPSFLSNPFG